METATKEQIKDWKAKYGENSLTQVTIKGDDGASYDYIIRRPARREMNAMGNHATKNDPSKVNDVLIKNCVLHGDTDVFDQDGSIYLTLVNKITQMMSVRESEVKKL